MRLVSGSLALGALVVAVVLWFASAAEDPLRASAAESGTSRVVTSSDAHASRADDTHPRLDGADRLEVDVSCVGDMNAHDDLVETPLLVSRGLELPVTGRSYAFEAPTTGRYHVDLTSHAFDAYLVIRDDSGRILGEDDDGLVELHARVDPGTLVAGRTYEVMACALHGELGPFDITVRSGPPDHLSHSEAAKAQLEASILRARHLEQTRGTSSPAYAWALNDLGVHLRTHGHFGESLACLRQSLAIRESLLGFTHQHTATTMSNLGVTLDAIGEHRAAQSYHEKVFAVRQGELGSDDPITLIALNNLAQCLAAQSDYGTARTIHELVLAARRGSLGSKHFDTVLSLNNLGEALRAQGLLAEARTKYEQALEIVATSSKQQVRALRSTLSSNLSLALGGLGELRLALALRRQVLVSTLEDKGLRHPETATAFTNAAGLLQHLGRHRQAIALLQNALAINASIRPGHIETPVTMVGIASSLLEIGNEELAWEHAEGALAMLRDRAPDHPVAANALFALGIIQSRRAEFEEAKNTLQESTRILERVYGPDHPEVAIALNNTGVVFLEQGDDLAARAVLERSVSILRANGTHPGALVSALHNLGQLMSRLGDSKQAQELVESALSMNIEHFGESHPDSITYRTTLAELLYYREDYAGAAEHLERVLSVSSEARDRTTGRIFNNLALVRLHQGRLDEADHDSQHALELVESSVHAGHPMRAVVINTRANVLTARGRLQEALELYERSVRLLSEAVGSSHTRTLTALSNIAGLYRELGETEEAWRVMSSAVAAGRNRRLTVLRSQTEQERYRFLSRTWSWIEGCLDIATDLQSAEALRAAFEFIADWRGRGLRMLTERPARSARQRSPEAAEVTARLSQVSSRLSAFFHGGLTATRPGDDAVEALLGERRDLERQLASLTDAEPSETRLSFHQLRDGLPDRSALLAFVNMRKRIGAGPDGFYDWTPRRASAWIVRHDSEAPEYRQLGTVEEIETAIRRFRAELREPSSLIRDVDPEVNDGLRSLVWDPLVPLLDGVDRIFVSPDGALASLPFETLEAADGTYLIERRQFVYLTDISAVARARPTRSERAPSLLVIGGVDFGQGASASGADAPDDLPASLHSALGRAFARPWTALPGTERASEEINDLHLRLFGNETDRSWMTGVHCTESRVKSALPDHRVVHLGTHGYFSPQGMPSMWEQVRAGDEDQWEMGESYRRVAGYHPGLLSGLVLAGANDEVQDAEGQDGYLTAEEVVWLDLSDVELVVLSACDTGLGKAEAGEGLLSLRRAFLTAGAETVVSSLWSVDDESARWLMQRFYENLWQRRMGRLDALRDAQLQLLAENRKHFGGAGLPETWGAFVLEGDWR